MQESTTNEIDPQHTKNRMFGEATPNYLKQRIKLKPMFASEQHELMPSTMGKKLVLHARRNSLGTNLWHCKRSRGLSTFYVASPRTFAVSSSSELVYLPLEEGGSLFVVVSAGDNPEETFRYYMSRPMKPEWAKLIKQFAEFVNNDEALAEPTRHFLAMDATVPLPCLLDVVGRAAFRPAERELNFFFQLQYAFQQQLDCHFDLHKYDPPGDSDTDSAYESDSEQDETIHTPLNPQTTYKKRKRDSDEGDTRPTTPRIDHSIFDDEFEPVTKEADATWPPPELRKPSLAFSTSIE